MANIYNQNSEPDVGSISISYDYLTNFVGISLLANDDDQVVSGIDVYISVKLLDGSKVRQILPTDANGRLGFFYNLTKVLSINMLAEIVTPSGTTVPISYESVIEHPAESQDLLTLVSYVNGYYIELSGRLSAQAGVNISNVVIEIEATNFDDGKLIKVTCRTDKTGFYSTQLLAGDGDWEIKAKAVINVQPVPESTLLNIILRRDDQKFTLIVRTVDISSRYTGYAAYPSNVPKPAGEIEILNKNLWNDNEFYMGRIVRDNNYFYFGLYKFGATSNGAFGLPTLFQLDNSNKGFIKSSTLIINDMEKYEMGRPNSYSYSCIYFDVTKDDGKRFLDKYFTYGKGGQEIKMEWIFRTY